MRTGSVPSRDQRLLLTSTFSLPNADIPAGVGLGGGPADLLKVGCR